jgi:phosphonopyruvate decarboxylase
MVGPSNYFELLKKNNINFFAGVPDSSLKNFTSYITDHCDAENNIITANEGSAIAIAAGHHLATEEIPFVYMQNSGIGNAVNPLLSLADEKVYQIPMLMMIGWRGEPGKKDEPQHKKQGEVTLSMLETMEIPYIVLSEDETEAIKQTEDLINSAKEKSIPHAIVVKPSVFDKYKLKTTINSNFDLSREEALKMVVDKLDEKDIVVSTTGKLSRELFEYREEKGQTHEKDFLTVGSMGHASAIAMGIALKKTNRRVFCFDGDGAVLMHTGNLSTVGTLSPNNFFHVIFNNGAHESVGGQPTVGFKVDFLTTAKAMGYKHLICADSKNNLQRALKKIENIEGPLVLEIKVGINSRDDLGRPTISPVDNKKNFIENLK